MRAIDNKYIGASKLRDDFLDVEDPTVSILAAARSSPSSAATASTACWSPRPKVGTVAPAPQRTHGLKQLPANAATAGSRRDGRLGEAAAGFHGSESPTPPAVKEPSTRRSRR